MSYVGKKVRRVDAVSKVKGEALYPGDFNYPNQCYMKILFAGRPHAIVRRVDASAAEAMPGVLAVFTSRDVPVNEFGLQIPDQPVLCGPGSSQPFADHVRFVGDRIAVVVAETEKLAEQACERIEVDYNDLPIVSDPLKAIEPDAVRIHPDHDSNVCVSYRIRKGDVETAFNRADVIVEGEYRTPAQEHAFLQPEAGVSYYDEEGRITVVVSGQWVHEDQEQIAHSLNLPPEKIRVIYPAIGGAFGGREDMSVQIILALATLRLHERGIDRPVKIVWSREESIIAHHKRHPFVIYTRWGANKDGKVIAAEVKLIADGGAYMSTSNKVLGNATLMCTGPYEIPNVKVDSYAVYTNNLPNGAFRGFGGPQGAFSAESQMNKLAEKLGLDPVEIRRRNLLTDGALLSVGTPLPPPVTIGPVVEHAAKVSGWESTPDGWFRPQGYGGQVKDKPYLKRGVGFACAFKNVGFSFGSPEGSWATVELHGNAEIDRVVLHQAGADVGQGAHTVFVQMAAEALGLPVEKIELVVSDTARTDNSGSASASRMTFMAGNAIKGAAEMALEKWKNEERPAIATFHYRAPSTTPFDPETGKSEPNLAYGYVAESAEVEVDTETGQIRILNIVCANDVGKAINPLLVRGQIEGGALQAAGYAVLENFIQKEGKVLTPFLSTYLIPTIVDIPDQVDAEIVEISDPRGPWGARGMAEMPFLPLVPAITDAVHNATGVWIDEFPLTPERVLKALGKLD